MAALTAASFTLAFAPKYDMWIEGGVKNVRGTIAFGNGVDTYVTTGIPMPAIGAFGFKTTMRTFEIFGIGGNTSDYLIRYNPATHRLLLYEEEAAAAGGPLLEADAAEAPAARTYTFLAQGW